MNTRELESYFARIGYSGARDATLKTLQALHALHPAAITFENLDPLLRRPVSLEPAALAAKLVAGKRGGYCYEHNTLFQGVLRALGFSVSTLAARVQWNVPAGTVTARQHMVLRIDLPEGPYLADVGFGRLTLTAPLRLVANLEQPTPHGLHRLVPVGNDFQLQARLRDGWAALYQLSLEEQSPADWDVANWYTSTSPQSVFTQSLMVARPVGDFRYALFNNELRIHAADGGTQRRLIASADELRSVLQDDFAIRLPEGAEGLLERLVGGSETS